jgi:hypothetical protein
MDYDWPGRKRCTDAANLAARFSLCSLSNVMVGLSHAIGHQLGGRCPDRGAYAAVWGTSIRNSAAGCGPPGGGDAVPPSVVT